MAEFALNALRYEDIRAGVVNFLKENSSYSAEFDFDGSNLAYQIDVMAYATMLLSYQNTLKSNNLFIDTTEIRKNGTSISKTMGYRPKFKVASRFSGTIEYFGDSAAGNTFVSGDNITIPARTQFISSPNNYIFTNVAPITLTFQNSVLLSGSFTILEGSFKTITWFGTGKKNQSIIINSENVENDNLLVSLRKTNTASSTNTAWTLADPFFSTTLQTIYFLEEDIENEFRPKILFGDGTLGQIPTETDTITIEYLKTRGLSVNGETGILLLGVPTVTKIGSFTYDFSKLSISVPDLQLSFGGKDNETLAEMQANAPRFYIAGGRGVTKDDLLTLLSAFPALKYFNVIGGNVLFETDDAERGISYITAVPAGIDESDFINNQKIYLSDIEENEIIPKLVEKTVHSTDRQFFKPTYIYLNLDPVIEVASTFSDEEVQTTTTATTANIQTFIDDNLKGLGKSFRISNLLSAAAETNGVLSTEIDIQHNFIINYDSFYASRSSRMDLPVIFQRDSNGNILKDERGTPLKTNFIKIRSDIIDDANTIRDAGDREQVSITTIADTAGSLDGKYFLLYSSNVDQKTGIKTVTGHYIWYDVDSGGNDPTPTGIPSGINVAISSGATANTVATATSQAINTQHSQHFTVTVAGNVVTSTNVTAGSITNSGDVDTGFTIIIEVDGRDTDYYTQFTLPISQSSIYSSLTHKNSDRKIYNIDVAKTEFITFELIGPTGSKVLTFNTFSFKDKFANVYLPNLFETATRTWAIQLNGRTIATLTQDASDEETFTLSAIDQNYLESTIGFINTETTTTIATDVITITKITETDVNNVVTTFYSLAGLLSDNVFTDIRLYGHTKLGDAQFDTTTFTWTYSNLKTYKDALDANAILSSLDDTAIDTNFLQVEHPDTTSDIMLSVTNFNGTFSLTNFLTINNTLNVYEQRNDLEFVQNFSLDQAEGNLTYEISSFSAKDGSDVQTLTLNAPEISEVVTVDGSSLDGKWFSLYSALNVTQYYVWFDDSAGSADPAPSGLTAIAVSITSGDSPQTVASNLASAVNNSSYVDFTAVVKGGADPEDKTVVITNAANGKTTDTSESPISGEETTFAFSTTTQGADNPTANIDLMAENDVLETTTASDSNNNGNFVIKSVNSTTGVIEIYNVNAVQNTDGVGVINHFEVTGTYGSFTINTFDIYHDISIGTLNYAKGDLNFKQTAKGYNDLANNKVIVENVKDIFNNYSVTTKMDSVKIVPIDLLSNAGLSLGQRTDFDELFSQSIQTLVTTPTVRK